MAVCTWAKASEVASWLGSLAMEGCILAQAMKRPLRSASAS